MKNQKVIDVYNGLVVKFKELVSEYEIDHNDYQALVDWMDQLGRAGKFRCLWMFSLKLMHFKKCIKV